MREIACNNNAAAFWMIINITRVGLSESGTSQALYLDSEEATYVSLDLAPQKNTNSTLCGIKACFDLALCGLLPRENKLTISTHLFSQGLKELSISSFLLIILWKYL